MISFTLKCENGHRFDSWFASGAAFETLVAAGHVSCIDCGSTQVQKALMSPAVTTDRAETVPEPDRPKQSAPDAPKMPAAAQSMAAGIPPLRALAKLRKHVEANADYVGRDFAKEVRAINNGSKPDRPVWGEVSGKEARELIEEGLPVAPLPFGPRKKSN